MTNQDFNIDDLEGPEFTNAAPADRPNPAYGNAGAPFGASELGGHYEACARCRGTGQTRWGTCFACRGKKGKTFVQPAAVRAANREKAADRRVRGGQANLDAFAAEHPVEWAWINDRIKWELTKADGQDWGQKTRAAIAKYGDLTEKWLAAVRTQVAKRAAAIEAAGQRVGAAPKIDVARIEVAFATAAAKGLGDLSLRLATTKPGPVVDGVVTEVLDHDYLFYPAKPNSRNPGGIYVREGKEYLGKIVAGAFRCVATCDDLRRDQVVQVASDPAKAAVAHGKVLGACGICNRKLSDPVSVNRGIGPVCAANYGF